MGGGGQQFQPGQGGAPNFSPTPNAGQADFMKNFDPAASYANLQQQLNQQGLPAAQYWGQQSQPQQQAAGVDTGMSGDWWNRGTQAQRDWWNSPEGQKAWTGANQGQRDWWTGGYGAQNQPQSGGKPMQGTMPNSGQMAWYGAQMPGGSFTPPGGGASPPGQSGGGNFNPAADIGGYYGNQFGQQGGVDISKAFQQMLGGGINNYFQ